MLLPTNEINSIFSSLISCQSHPRDSADRQPEASLGHAVLTCPQAGRLWGRPAHGFTGCLRRALHLCGWQPSHSRSWHGSGRRFFINVYWFSQENLKDRTAAVPRLRQSNKECHTFWKHLSSKFKRHTYGHNNVFSYAPPPPNTHTHKWQHSVSEQKAGWMFS